MTAIEKMVEYAESWMDCGIKYSRGQIIEAIVNKARLLLDEEKARICETANPFNGTALKVVPSPDLWGQHKQMVKLAQYHGLHLAANWAINMSGKTCSDEQSNRTAITMREADIVDWKNHKEEFKKWWSNRPPCADDLCPFFKEKPTAPASLVDELKSYLNDDCPPIAWYFLTSEEKEYFKGVECVQKRIGEILSRYRPANDEGDKLSTAANLLGDLSTSLELYDPNNALIEKANLFLVGFCISRPAPAKKMRRVKAWAWVNKATGHILFASTTPKGVCETSCVIEIDEKCLKGEK